MSGELQDCLNIVPPDIVDRSHIDGPDVGHLLGRGEGSERVRGRDAVVKGTAGCAGEWSGVCGQPWGKYCPG